MSFKIINRDITAMQVDAIVNAANTGLQMGGGVCGAISRSAGPTDMQRACDMLAPIRTGEAVITLSFCLKSKYVIHTAGPVYDRTNPGKSQERLRLSYHNALMLAWENGCRSIAFPLISSGIYGYPYERALQVAKSAIQGFLEDKEMDVLFVLWRSKPI